MSRTAEPPFDLAADECYRCGYQLRGVADDQPCPECGLLAERSRRPTDELYDTRPGWLARLAWGVRLILLALLALVAWPFIAQVATEQLRFARGWASARYALWVHAMWFGADAAALFLLGGVWLLTGREGYGPADRADASRRFLLRFVAFAPVLGLLILHGASQAAAAGGPGNPMWADSTGPGFVIPFILGTVGTAPLPVLLYLQLRSLAKRAHSAHLAEHCLIVGVGNALTLLYIPLFALLGAYAEQWGLGSNWSSRSKVSLAMTVALCASSLLFALWNVYLLVAFSFAFARASGQLRRAWRRSDRSVPAV
jgi:hypothetical protein